MDFACPQVFLLDTTSVVPQTMLGSPQDYCNVIWQLSEQYRMIVDLNYQLQLKLSREQSEKQSLID